MFEIIIFSVGVAGGLWLYGKGWRAQTPFYRVPKGGIDPSGPEPLDDAGYDLPGHPG